ncbi:Alpha-(1,6)-fucosyltransferase [Acipenser ruthenus]|uniref:Alpha-(1,6)-fucosyltransferase n=1 Tax=Acipenser ruthenus TaxID=7906 RepID=A0A444V509_ACIRT|nr:Alpha-(1,6)-fucosyltransferase [Acipenser ruthenus]
MHPDTFEELLRLVGPRIPWNDTTVRQGEANDRDVQVVELPIVDSLHPRPPYLPLAIPEDLADRLDRLHGDPSVWWVSQFVKYLIRPQPWLEKEIDEATRKMGFKHPIIGKPKSEAVRDRWPLAAAAHLSPGEQHEFLD